MLLWDIWVFRKLRGATSSTWLCCGAEIGRFIMPGSDAASDLPHYGDPQACPACLPSPADHAQSSASRDPLKDARETKMRSPEAAGRSPGPHSAVWRDALPLPAACGLGLVLSEPDCQCIPASTTLLSPSSLSGLAWQTGWEASYHRAQCRACARMHIAPMWQRTFAINDCTPGLVCGEDFMAGHGCQRAPGGPPTGGTKVAGSP